MAGKKQQLRRDHDGEESPDRKRDDPSSPSNPARRDPPRQKPPVEEPGAGKPATKA